MRKLRLRMKIGKDTTICERFTYNNPENISIGEKTYINHDVDVIAKKGSIRIGNNVGIGPYTYISAFKHDYRDKNKLIHQQGDTYADVTIQDDVWIGAHVTIIAGVTIYTGAVVGAGAVVTKDVAPYTVVAGVPARPIKKRVKGKKNV